MMQKLLFPFFIILSFIGYGQNIQLSEETEVSILTCETGNVSYSLYGHTGIRIKDQINNLDIVYNYGTFDFDTPNFILKFVKGDLQYFMSVSTYPNFEYGYQYENRSIYQQTLTLSKEKKQLLFNSLNADLNSEKRFYTYKFIDRNCTNMVIDKINTLLEDTIITTKKPVDITYREILYPYSKNHFFEQLGINIIFGTKVDQKAERLFLPLELLNVLKTTKLEDKPLVSETKTLFEAKPANYKPSLLNSIYTIILLLTLILLANKKWLNTIYFTLIGFVGIFLCSVGFYSFHEEVMWNYNALLFNPLYLVLLFYYYKNDKKKIIIWGKIIVAILLAYVVYMLNKIHLYLMSPFIITHFIFLSRIILKNKKATQFKTDYNK
ncbi:lipoprotein N-acyltransferase Lnb domain-containing protein [Flavobacterium sp. HNIBRBA15423]|uniref:lipoprotein N-acyltransferase Lnb domain-containing protein n=1 Tax=Flavobacterium sp. HNIBRBA15423 TaxID=3458683 RepID=UPI0040444075